MPQAIEGPKLDLDPTVTQPCPNLVPSVLAPTLPQPRFGRLPNCQRALNAESWQSDRLKFQDIFDIKLTGIDSYREEVLKSRVTSYRVVAAHSELAGKLDQKEGERGRLPSAAIFFNLWVFIVIKLLQLRSCDCITHRDVIMSCCLWRHNTTWRHNVPRDLTIQLHVT